MKFISFILCLMLIFSTSLASEQDLNEIGFHFYYYEDTFISSVRDNIRKFADEYNDVRLKFYDSQNSQSVQNENISEDLENGTKCLGVNIVDITTAPYIVQKAKGIPVVFFNREPILQDMPNNNWYYIGANAEESGRLCGEIIADYFLKNPQADKNKDGIIQYVMLVGETGHQDAILRTKFSIKAIEDSGFKTMLLGSQTANWQRVAAHEKMSAWLGTFSNIEAVICNNDDMALGAIDALKAAGYFVGDNYIPVVGVDATYQAIEALKEGTLLGTVLNDSKNIAKSVFEACRLLAMGKDLSTLPYPLVDGKYIWVPYQKVTIDNYKNYE